MRSRDVLDGLHTSTGERTCSSDEAELGTLVRVLHRQVFNSSCQFCKSFLQVSMLTGNREAGHWKCKSSQGCRTSSQGTQGDIAGSQGTLGDVAGSQGTMDDVAVYQRTLGNVACY